jgi:pyruvate dehydrogenase E2 component (dihydrolipoamide acetyltransferase)
MKQVLMPKLGDTMEEGKILAWRKQVGDTVKKGDAIAEIETEKVNIEAESYAEGVLRQILVPAGATVAIGTPIALVGDPSEPLEGGGQAGAAPRAAAATGDAAAAGTAASASATQAAGANGTNGHAAGATASAIATGERIIISPIARRIAGEHHLDITQLQGTGPNGRIIREDVEAALAAAAAVPTTAAATPAIPATPEAQPVAAVQPDAVVTAVPLTQMRKTIAKRLQQSMQTIPHFYMTMAIDVTRLGELRRSLNEYAGSLPQPVKITINDLVMRAVALALKAHPEVNVSLDGDRILFKSQINLGMAVALDRGLIVPVITGADRRTVLEIAREARRLAEAARANTLKPEEFQGGTFTISNAGMYGVESFTAVINPPEVAILAVGAAVPTPVVVEGQVAVRDVLKVTLSSDHRVLDGAVAARFLQELKRLLEQPMGLLV